jgi:hypothetical protein
VVGQSVCRHIHIPPNNKQQKPTNKTNKQVKLQTVKQTTKAMTNKQPKQ